MNKKSNGKTVAGRRNEWLIGVTVLLMGIFLVGGCFVRIFAEQLPHAPFIWLLAVCVVVPALLMPLNVLLRKRFVRKFQRRSVGEMQQYLLSHREFARKTSARKLALIKALRVLTDLYAALLFMFAAGVAFSSGIVFARIEMGAASPLYFVSILWFLASLSRIRFLNRKVLFEENKTYVPAQDYPHLYALARRAADALQCSGEIKIALLPDCSAGIAAIWHVYSVQLGVILLHTVSEEELYTILLHEFAHAAGNHLVAKEAQYNDWICSGGNAHFLSGVTSLLFSYSDTVYSVQYELYRYSASLMQETEADRAMIRYGHAKEAASALRKINYFEYFQWEKGTHDMENLFASETPVKTVITEDLQAFKRAIPQRAEAWDRLIDVEILSRSASHPTLKMRLEALGITDASVFEAERSEAYTQECEKALSYVEELIYESRMQTYAEDRKNEYTIPKQLVEAWEEAGKPVIAEEYADIGFALRKLGRIDEANALYDRAIADLPEPANLCAYYMKGCYLLHRYDEAGLAYVYRAVENDNKYIEEGLEIIGSFCCLTGRQADLDIYREKAVVLAQKSVDVYAQMSVLRKNDRLSSERLPDGLLEDILKFVQSIDSDGWIARIYLVRKSITADFFTSAFVVKFAKQTPESVHDEIMHKIFSYLDTCSTWQFSLFDYSEAKDCKIEAIENSCVYAKSGRT